MITINCYFLKDFIYLGGWETIKKITSKYCESFVILYSFERNENNNEWGGIANLLHFLKKKKNLHQTKIQIQFRKFKKKKIFF